MEHLPTTSSSSSGIFKPLPLPVDKPAVTNVSSNAISFSPLVSQSSKLPSQSEGSSQLQVEISEETYQELLRHDTGCTSTTTRDGISSSPYNTEIPASSGGDIQSESPPLALLAVASSLLDTNTETGELDSRFDYHVY
uniref:Uncharacterized protein n=1 Tax=Moniliophthora roreri TaxID=221103 RepID=A0A0W0FBU2_MONRR